MKAEASKKRYNSIRDWLWTQFGERVYKVSLKAGLSCPNRDGTIGKSGCVFCNFESYRPATALVSPETRTAEKASIKKQLSDGIAYIRKRHKAKKFIGYFQSGSNTHAPTEKLSPLFHDAISDPAVVGLAVSTRPDCIEDGHINLFSELSRKKLLWVELGLQSAHDRTLEKINRGHSVQDFRNAATALVQNNIYVCAHVILGLPGETLEMMRETAHFLNEMNIWGVKIHNLHVLKGTRLDEMYQTGKVKIPTLESYANWVVDFLEVLDPRVVIHRVNSHSPRSLTAAPAWSINKLAIFNAVEMELDRRDTHQGIFKRTHM